MAKKKWMIYGANGYTGELIARQAKELGLLTSGTYGRRGCDSRWQKWPGC